jgi:hypothetical protein
MSLHRHHESMAMVNIHSTYRGGRRTRGGEGENVEHYGRARMLLFTTKLTPKMGSSIMSLKWDESTTNLLGVSFLLLPPR